MGAPKRGVVALAGLVVFATLIANADDGRELTLSDLAPKPAASPSPPRASGSSAAAASVSNGSGDAIDARHVILNGVKMVRIEKGGATIYVPEFKDFSPDVLQQGLCAPPGVHSNEVEVARAETSLTDSLKAYSSVIQRTLAVKCSGPDAPQVEGTRGRPPQPEIGISSTSTDKDGIEQEKKVYVRPRSAGVGMSF